MRVKSNDQALCPYKPVWDLPASRFGNNRWIFYSTKLHRFVTSYSDLEHDHCVRVEANPKVVTYCEQPLRARARTPSGFVTTVFDMWVLYDSGEEEFHEVKYRDQLNEPRVQRQLAVQRMLCDQRKARHQLFDEYHIRQRPLYLTNWKFILRCLASYHRQDLTNICDGVLQLLQGGFKSLGDIHAAMDFPEHQVRVAVFRLLHTGEISAPLDTDKITNALRITRI